MYTLESFGILLHIDNGRVKEQDVVAFFTAATHFPSVFTLYHNVCVNELLFLLILMVTLPPIVLPVIEPNVDFL